MDAPRLRFAPSPSGFLHIGGARTALFCWLLARRHGGSFVLRVEDTDAARSTDESIRAIIDGLRWLGMDWDEGPDIGGPHAPYFQSRRKDTYQRYVDQLVGDGKVYRCYCTPEELQAKRDMAMAENRAPIYDGEWRDRDPSDWPADQPYVLRLRAPSEGETVVNDAVKGRIVFPNKEIGDQVVVRSNGDPLYNFVVVIDDMLMGITHVVRGDDHLSNTPKQVQLYEALGATPPVFAHVPLILGPDKKRLSKRHGATSVMAYAEQGYLSDAMVNYLARLGWSHGDQEIFSRDQLIGAFDLEHVGKSPGVWDPDKLLWVNAQHLAKTPTDELAALVAPMIEAAGYGPQAIDSVLFHRIDTLRGRARRVEEFVTAGAFYWQANGDVDYTQNPKAVRKFLKPASAELLQAAAEELEALSDWNEQSLEAALTPLLDRFELKMGKLAQPIRISVTGTNVSPGLFETLAALGRDKTIPRVRHGIGLCTAPPPQP